MGKTFDRSDTNKVKGLAIIIMIIHHCFLDPDRYKGHDIIFAPFSEDAVNAFALSMKICVALFTFCSAYGITVSYRSKHADYNFSGKEAAQTVIRRLIILLCGFIFVFIIVNLYDILVIGDGRYLKVYGSGLTSVVYFILDAVGLAELFSTPTYLATFWYMSLAILLIIFIPLLLKLYNSMGWITLLGFAVLFKVLFPVTSGNHFAYLPNYLFCIIIGMIAADKNLIVKLSENHFGIASVSIRKTAKCIFLALSIILLIVIRQKTRSTPLLPVCDGLISFGICWWMYEFGNHIPLVKYILEKLGKYSMNMFLIHNFIRIIWYYDFTYSFRYWVLIALVLTVISFILSFGIEMLKKVVRFDKAVEFLVRKAANISM